MCKLSVLSSQCTNVAQRPLKIFGAKFGNLRPNILSTHIYIVWLNIQALMSDPKIIDLPRLPSLLLL